MKKVFQTEEIAHLWMHQSQQEARNPLGNFYFDGDTIYSYGRHFPIARHVVGKNGARAILFTTRGYSPTTSKHLRFVRQAFHGNGVPVFQVYNPSQDLPQHLTGIQDRIKSFSESVIDPKIRQATRTKRWEELQTLVADSNRFCEFFGVKPSFKLPESIETLSATLETERKKNEAKAKRAKAREDKLRRERIAREREASKEHIAAWIAGLDTLPNGDRVRIPYGIPEAYMRVEDGEVVTSQGAHFPIEHALRVFKFISDLRGRGVEWKSNGHTLHVGVFKIDSIDRLGNVKAGCHVVEWDEIQRFANVLQASLLPA